MTGKLDYVERALGEGILSEDKNVLDRIGTFSETKGAGDITILSAIYLFSKYINTPELAIKTAAFLKGADTDTIASITGGLVGAFCGCEWIPTEWRNVQDRDYIVDLAERLYAHVKPDNMNNKERERIKSVDTPVGSMEFLSDQRIQGKYSEIILKKYRFEFGQSIYIKYINNTNSNMITSNSENKKDNNLINICVSEREFEKLINDPIFNRISFKKIGEIILCLRTDRKIEDISKKYKVDSRIVEVINSKLLG